VYIGQQRGNISAINAVNGIVIWNVLLTEQASMGNVAGLVLSPDDQILYLTADRFGSTEPPGVWAVSTVNGTILDGRRFRLRQLPTPCPQQYG
jgi:outer membrane protein assembly factor BamB